MIKPTHFFKCLSDETRLHATLLVALEGELCVCELTEALKDSQPKISRHLAHLRNAGVLEDVRRGQWVFYEIAHNLPDWARQILTTTAEANTDTLKPFRAALKAMQGRPQRC